ncbi:MAG: mevalonate kinase [Chloroflexi bacterium]|nr:mevalonate kinase [Chloroflexota bacterium]
MTSASAFGKIILFGEHAVVYGRPAIAVPVTQVRATATIAATKDARVWIDATDLARRYALDEAGVDDPLAKIIWLTCMQFSVEPSNFSVQIHSTIPVARGLGSGAAVSVALARALAKHFNRTLSGVEASALAYEVEKLHHGTPSGIDNTVVAFEEPVYFVKGKPVETFRIARTFMLAIADTGIAAPTKIAVGDVRRAWEVERARFETLFDEIGEIARKARNSIERGEISSLGSLMLKNQALLQEIGVSSEEIERLVDSAIGAGAEGAKLSGAGRGGNVIALVDEETWEEVTHAMKRAGAVRVIVTEIR